MKWPYTIGLTQEEVNALYVVLMSVAGDPAGPRGQSASVLDKIRHRVFGHQKIKVEGHIRIEWADHYKPREQP